jgi:hypothetical protein
VRRSAALLRALAAVAAVSLGGGCAPVDARPAAALAQSEVDAAWRRFQAAMAADDREAVAALTAFPFEGRGRSAFVSDFDGVFTPGLRRQVAGGTLHRVTAAEAAEAKDNEEDLCGAVGEYVVEPAPSADANAADADQEIFRRLVFRATPQGLRLTRIAGCA